MLFGLFRVRRCILEGLLAFLHLAVGSILEFQSETIKCPQHKEKSMKVRKDCQMPEPTFVPLNLSRTVLEKFSTKHVLLFVLSTLTRWKELLLSVLNLLSASVIFFILYLFSSSAELLKNLQRS